MNNDQKICDPQRIELSLQQRLSDEEQAAFELHLDDCDECRRRLEEAAAGDDVWSAVRESLSDGQPDAALSSDPACDATTAGDGSFGHQTVLKLLAPTDDERMLGRLGMYEVVGVIGCGGMGVVLKAFDPALNRYVAIKVLAPHLGSSGAARKRFSREAQAAAAVVHENVIEIHGVADADGLPYLVMPYVRGPSLQRRLDDDGPLESAEILRIGVQTATGLAAAHAQGLVHRDVKPANILLADGVERVKLTDFGLARAADDASLTRTGVIAGTPQYMSPEQARGESVDQRSDLFSLGSVLYAMCTGRAPFRAETSYGVLRRITDEEPRPIRELNPNIPEWLCQIIARLMSKQPDERFQSAREVARLLEECLAHVQQPTIVPLPAPLRTQTASRRLFSTSRRSLGVIVMIATFSLGLLGMALWQAMETPPTELYVRTNPPGATLFLDGKELGTAPNAFEVNAGKHELLAVLDGYKSAKREVTIRETRMKRIILTLPRAGSPATALPHTVMTGKNADLQSRGLSDVSLPAQPPVLPISGPWSKQSGVLIGKLVVGKPTIEPSERFILQLALRNANGPGGPWLAVQSGNPLLFEARITDAKGSPVMPTSSRSDVVYTAKWMVIQPSPNALPVIPLSIRNIDGAKGSHLDTTTSIWKLPPGTYQISGTFSSPKEIDYKGKGEPWIGKLELPPVTVRIASNEIERVLPTTEAEKAIARLVLVFFGDRSRQAIPAVLIDAGSETLVVAAGPATIVPDGTPPAVDRSFVELPGRPPLTAKYLEGTKELNVYRTNLDLTDYRPPIHLELAVGDQLSAILPGSSSVLSLTPNAARVVSLSSEADLKLPDRKLEHHFDQLVEINRTLPEGTPLFKEGELAGLTLLGTRFLGRDAKKSYVVPVERLAALCREARKTQGNVDSQEAFGQVRERKMPFGAPCVMKYFQFHTGDVFEIGDGPGDTSSHAEQYDRAELTGGLDFSAIGGKEHIQLAGKGCIFTGDKHPSWDKQTAQQTLTQLQKATWLTGVLEIDTKKLPITYLFKTGRGECGILQILAVTEDERGYHELGMKFRYKLVQSTIEESEIEKQARLGVVPEVPWTKTTLPDVDRRDVNTILDLSSGEFQKNLMRDGTAESFAAFNKLGRGDLWYDSVLGTMRGATVKKWDGEKWTDVSPGKEQHGVRNYPTLVPPVRLLVTTAEGKTFDVVLLAEANNGGLAIEYRPVDVRPPTQQVPKPVDSPTSLDSPGVPSGVGYDPVPQTSELREALDIDALRMTSESFRLQGFWKIVEQSGPNKTEGKESDSMNWVLLTATDRRFFRGQAADVLFDTRFMLPQSSGRRKKINLFYTHRPDDETRGIYSLNGDALRLCLPSSSNLDRPTEFRAGGESLATLMTLKRFEPIVLRVGKAAEPFDRSGEPGLKSVEIANPAIVDFAPVDGKPLPEAEKFQFTGKKAGYTTLTITDQNDKKTHVDVIVNDGLRSVMEGDGTAQAARLQEPSISHVTKPRPYQAVPSITGRINNVVGEPAIGYRVTALPRAWSTQGGSMPDTVTDENGKFQFRGLPDGPCDVAVTSTPLTNQPNIRIMDIVLKKGKPVHVELSLERKFHYSGRVADTTGKPQPDCNVLAIWKDPTGKNKYSSNTKTDSFGRYNFSVPFAMAESIQLNGSNTYGVAKQQDVEHGRDDIDFQLATPITKKLDFLADIREFRRLHLEMNEADLQLIIDLHSLATSDSQPDDSTMIYHLYTPDGENVVVTFHDGKCAGIQRMPRDLDMAKKLYGPKAKEESRADSTGEAAPEIATEPVR